MSRIQLATMLAVLILTFSRWLPAIASDDHDEARNLKNQGAIIALSELIYNAGLSDVKILEVKLENERGKLLYELEFLDAEGRIFEQYFDAITGEPITEPRRD